MFVSSKYLRGIRTNERIRRPIIDAWKSNTMRNELPIIRYYSIIELAVVFACVNTGSVVMLLSV